jgi:hypothetical protein
MLMMLTEKASVMIQDQLQNACVNPTSRLMGLVEGIFPGAWN